MCDVCVCVCVCTLRSTSGGMSRGRHVFLESGGRGVWHRPTRPITVGHAWNAGRRLEAGRKAAVQPRRAPSQAQSGRWGIWGWTTPLRGGWGCSTYATTPYTTTDTHTLESRWCTYIHNAAHCVGADHDQRQTRPGSPGKADRPRASTVTRLAGCRCGRGRLLPRADRPCLRGPECAAGRALHWGLHAYAGAQGSSGRHWRCSAGHSWCKSSVSRARDRAHCSSRGRGGSSGRSRGAVDASTESGGEWMRYIDDENVGAAACVACCPEGAVVSSRFFRHKTSSRQSVVPDLTRTGQRTGSDRAQACPVDCVVGCWWLSRSAGKTQQAQCRDTRQGSIGRPRFPPEG